MTQGMPRWPRSQRALPARCTAVASSSLSSVPARAAGASARTRGHEAWAGSCAAPTGRRKARACSISWRPTSSMDCITRVSSSSESPRRLMRCSAAGSTWTPARTRQWCRAEVTPPTDLLSSIGICVGAAALLAVAGWRLRQPLILAYLVAGVVIGPQGLKWVTNQESIGTVAEIGLILLLFVIGLEIDLKKLASAGPSVLLTGALQVPICLALGLAFFLAIGVRMGGGDYSLIYLAACMSLSSTLVVVKLLYDKFELDTLPGRITLGVLVIQDLWAVAMLAVQPNLTNPDLLPLAFSLWKGALMVVGSLFISKNVLPFLFRSVAKAPELVLVSGLAWCFFLSGVASFVGLSPEMGALIAGISLSTFPYNLDVMAKAVSIRDFFVTLFFVALGMQIPIPTWQVVGIALAASAFVMLSRLSVVPILYALGLGHRASLLPAINLAQVSEFSIVIASLGFAAHQIGPDVLTIVIITFAVTAVASTYMINSNHRLQKVMGGWLKAIG